MKRRKMDHSFWFLLQGQRLKT